MTTAEKRAPQIRLAGSNSALNVAASLLVSQDNETHVIVRNVGNKLTLQPIGGEPDKTANPS